MKVAIFIILNLIDAVIIKNYTIWIALSLFRVNNWICQLFFCVRRLYFLRWYKDWTSYSFLNHFIWISWLGSINLLNTLTVNEVLILSWCFVIKYLIYHYFKLGMMNKLTWLWSRVEIAFAITIIILLWDCVLHIAASISLTSKLHKLLLLWFLLHFYSTF